MMGYEIKLVAGCRGTGQQNDWVEKVVEIELSKCGHNQFGDLNTKRPTDDGKTFYYADDGNTQVREDNYGEPLRIRTIDETITALKAELRGKEKYRRFVVALAMLEAIEKTFSATENLVVLLYGY
jgi:hypothetical protein